MGEKLMLPSSASPKRCLIHGGTPKTGSTAIQIFAFNKREELKGLGVQLSTTGWSADGPGNHELLFALEAPKDINAKFLLGQFEEELNKIEGDILISSEVFYILSHKLDIVVKLQDIIEKFGFLCEYIFYFRTQRDYIASYFAEITKHGSIDEFDSYFKKFMKTGIIKGPYGHQTDLDYHRGLNRIAMATKRSVRAFAYCGLSEGAGVLQHFFNEVLSLGIDINPDDMGWINHRVGPHFTQTMLLINRLRAGGVFVPQASNEEMVRRARERDANRTFEPLTDEEAGELVDRFAAANAQLLESWQVDLSIQPAIPEGLAWRGVANAEEFRIRAPAATAADLLELTGMRLSIEALDGLNY